MKIFYQKLFERHDRQWYAEVVPNPSWIFGNLSVVCADRVCVVGTRRVFILHSQLFGPRSFDLRHWKRLAYRIVDKEVVGV
jgi:hypothetical protein